MFRVHRSNRMEELVLALAGVVARPLASAFEQEVVLVQSKGMQRWVALELARRHGIFANARFPFPRTFIDEVLDAVLGTDPATLSRERAAWALSALMPELVSREELAPIRRYLADDPRGKSGASCASASPTCSTNTRCIGRTGCSSGTRGWARIGRPSPGVRS